jgi:pimeloyl-ACP methyl ester carboxylesterase
MNEGYRERTYASDDGLRLCYRDYGDPLSAATAVLCLPGLTRNAKDFHSLALWMSRQRRVLCPDYRGRGRSEYDPDWRHYRPATYVNDLRHLLIVANLHRVVVIGTSLGGILATAMAVAMPCALAGVVLNDIGPVVERAGMSRIIEFIQDVRPQPDWDTAARHLRKTLPFLPDDDADGWLDLAHATYRECGDGLLRADWDPALVKPLLRSGELAGDLWSLFGALDDLPKLALRGEHSDVLSPATFELMADRMQGLECITVPGVGHVPALKDTATRKAIDDLLARA